MAWNVDFTPEAERWYGGLNEPQRAKFSDQVDQLRRGGPTLGRPAVDSIKGSRHRNMKELRLPDSGVRALFAFGPDRRAIILVGGDKSGNEKRWYRQHTRVADKLFTQHLAKFGRGSAWHATRAGTKSAGRQI